MTIFTVFKYKDGMASVGLFLHLNMLSMLLIWYKASSLLIKVVKTKKLISNQTSPVFPLILLFRL